jgi:hypothetical protein
MYPLAIPSELPLIDSWQAVQATTKRNLSKIKGLSETKVDKIKEAAGKLFVYVFSSQSR